MRIFIPEFLPLANRGEEAIARGVQDMFGGYESVELGIMGKQEHVITQGNITVFPLRWLYSFTDNVYRSRTKERMIFLVRILVCRQGMLGRQANLYSGHDKYRPMQEFFGGSDLVLVGHDGLFSLESCGVIFAAKRRGKRAGILGAGISRSRRHVGLYGPVYRKAVAASDFCYLREQGSYELMKEICAGDAKVKLAPDPAFAMKPASREEIAVLLKKYPWYLHARQQGRPLVFVTVCQKSIVFDQSFLGLSGQKKIDTHLRFLAELLKSLIIQRDAHVVFLPHSTEAGEGNDIAVSHSVYQRLESVQSCAAILDEELTACQLKGLIREADFLVAERTHSMIGSVDMTTPFVALTNTKDLRTQDIVGAMCGCQDQIINMDYPNQNESIEVLLRNFDGREGTRRLLKTKAAQLRTELETVASHVAEGI